MKNNSEQIKVNNKSNHCLKRSQKILKNMFQANMFPFYIPNKSKKTEISSFFSNKSRITSVKVRKKMTNLTKL